MIEKKQNNINNQKFNLIYYNRARDAMFDVIEQLSGLEYQKILLPGYIGLSPKEGSGIFDPINKITSISRCYYKMTYNLDIDVEDFKNKLEEHSIVLLVNYFGFRDRYFREIIEIAHSRNCMVVEDNAHGFYTHFCKGKSNADITFFSLHKMFPFSEGGALLIQNNNIGIVGRKGTYDNDYQPFSYDIHEIAKIREDNFIMLEKLVAGKEELFWPLRTRRDLTDSVPQSYPIVIEKGNRDEIYEIMNDNGYGVVSLYHTMIDELRQNEYKEACRISKRILNLPVHQDCDNREFYWMIEKLEEVCRQTVNQ